MPKIIIDSERCKSCGLCVGKCPVQILQIDKKRLNRKGYNPVRITDMDKCLGCKRCATICPDCVFTIQKKS